MLRHLYRCVVRLHPQPFRLRFGEEMLSVFDLTQARAARFGLLLDGIFSSFRQWIFRPQFWAESTATPACPVAEGVPTFSSLDDFRPRASAVIDGLVFSAVLFTLMCFAIRYSWIRVLHIQVPEYQVESYLGIHPASSPSHYRGAAAPAKSQEQTPKTDASGLISEHLQVDVMPVEAGPATTPLVSAPANPQAIPLQLQLTGTPVGLQLRVEWYAGTYKSQSPHMTIEVTVEEGQLSIHIPGEPSRALAAATQTTFAMIGDENSWIEFVPGATGKMQRLVLSRGGHQIVAERPFRYASH